MTVKQLALISDFITVDHGKYIVKVSVFSDGVILGSALAGEDTVEKAEDEARKRAIALINTDISIKVPSKNDKTVNIEPSPKTPNLQVSVKTQTQKKDSPTVKSSNKSVKKEEQSTPEVLRADSADLWGNMLSLPEDELNMTVNEDQNWANNPQDTDNYSSENTTEPSVNLASTENTETANLFDSEPVYENNRNSHDNNLILFPSESQEEDSSSEPSLTLPLDLSDTIDFSQIIDQTSIEMKRLGWTQDQGKKYLLETYGKKSRHLLSDEELIEFLQYLQTQ
jgi:hypothetical protein